VVKLRVAPAGDDVEFRVADSGPGIPADHRSRICERFHQVESPETRARGGTGLGLSISKGLVEQHGGTIGLESEEGRGSTFWFRIARAPVE
jgi:signal transduction histidine kinase